MSLWLLGGHDPTHGAGLFRDLVSAKAIAPAVPRRFAVTACTEQGRGRPARAWPVPAARLQARMHGWPSPRAIKLGLVPDALAPVVAAAVADRDAPVVLDPVLHASDGGALGASVEGLAPLLAAARLVTPNLVEAHALLGRDDLRGEDLALALAERLRPAAVLLKGGHDPHPARVVDWLCTAGEIVAFERARVPGPDPRGTGCALASAIAAGLASANSLREAVAQAVAWLDLQRRGWIEGPDGRAHLPGPSRPPRRPPQPTSP